jgi:hypothetical protein
MAFSDTQARQLKAKLDSQRVKARKENGASHAHHIRYAQAKGLGLKVSDEFTVPLCASHHSENHATGNELKWWQDHKIEPLSVAQRLWYEFRDLNQPGRRQQDFVAADQPRK